jgi:hypothetical protein
VQQPILWDREKPVVTSMAGFEVTAYGRFWVTAEVRALRPIDLSRAAHFLEKFGVSWVMAQTGVAHPASVRSTREKAISLKFNGSAVDEVLPLSRLLVFSASSMFWSCMQAMLRFR